MKMIWMYYDCFSFNVCSSAAAIALGFDKVVEFGSRVFTIFGGDYSFWLFYSLLSFTILKRRARICMWRSVFFTIYFLLHKNNRATYIVVVGVGHPWVSEFPPPLAYKAIQKWRYLVVLHNFCFLFSLLRTDKWCDTMYLTTAARNKVHGRNVLTLWCRSTGPHQERLLPIFLYFASQALVCFSSGQHVFLFPVTTTTGSNRAKTCSTTSSPATRLWSNCLTTFGKGAVLSRFLKGFQRWFLFGLRRLSVLCCQLL